MGRSAVKVSTTSGDSLGECLPSQDSAASSLDLFDVDTLQEPCDALKRIECSGFRQARAGQLQVNRRFPALMKSKRMVPAWQDAEPSDSSKDEIALKRAQGPRG